MTTDDNILYKLDHSKIINYRGKELKIITKIIPSYNKLNARQKKLLELAKYLISVNRDKDAAKVIIIILSLIINNTNSLMDIDLVYGFPLELFNIYFEDKMKQN